MANPEAYDGVPPLGHNNLADAPSESPIPQPEEVEIDDAKVTAHYSNFCRLSASPEELLIDFGLNPQPVGVAARPIAVSQRIVTGWHTAKRLLHVLQLTIERHEAAFGVLETDVRKRVLRG